MLIVCSQTGTVLNAEHCLFFDPDGLPPEARDEWEGSFCDSNDNEVSRIAERYGQSALQVLDTTSDDADLYKTLATATRKELAERSIRSGDLTWNNCVPYSPEALREVLTDMADECEADSEAYKAIYYASRFATDEWLEKLGSTALEGDKAWVNYKSSIIDALMELYGGE